MKKNDSALSALTQNIKNLIPYVGILLVVAGIIGLVFIQNPLQKSQDLRGEAADPGKSSVAYSPYIKPELRVPFVVNKTGEVALYLDSANYSFVKAQVVFTIINNSLDTPEIIVNQGSGFDAESIEIEQINGGYFVSVVAVPNNLDWLVPPSDISFIRIKLVPRATGNITIAFDPDRTYASTSNLDVHLQVPAPLQYSITGGGSTQQTQCVQSGGVWREFPNNCVDTCGEDFVCLDILTMGCDCGAYKCWDGATCAGNPGGSPDPTSTPNPTSTPLPTATPNPTSTPLPTATPPVIQGCNQVCTSNNQCAINMFCYQTGTESRCRLATNPTNASCQSASTTGNTLKSCNESCVSNANCVTGLTCWNSTCRNPLNPQSTSCAAPSTQQTTTTIQQCGQACTSNANCAVNLRCYEGQCRLATNPSSTSCSAITEKTVSTTYSKKVTNATTSADIKKSDTPIINKGDNRIPVTDLTIKKQDSVSADRLAPDENVESKETLLGFFRSLINNSESKLPFFIILFGILLLVLSILFAILGRLRNTKNTTVYHPSRVDSSKIDVKTYDVKPDLENQQKD